MTSQGYLIVGKAGSKELSRLLFLIPAFYAIKVQQRIKLASLQPLKYGEQEVGPEELGGNIELTLTNWPFERTAWIVQRFPEPEISEEAMLSPDSLRSFYRRQQPTLDCTLPDSHDSLRDARLPTGFLERYFGVKR